jgi:transcriptional regulator with XRE-family HTH domain
LNAQTQAAFMDKSLRSEKQLALQKALKDARLKAGLTQSQLAKLLGKPQSFVAKYELGERRLDVIEFTEICKFIDVNLD